MKLDKSHLNQFENISPPLRNALTIPVEGVTNVHIYVSQSPFGVPGTYDRDAVLEVAKALTLRPEAIKTVTDPDFVGQLVRAIDIIMHAPGAHQDVADSLMSAVNNLKEALDEAREALIADAESPPATLREHNALVSLFEALGETVPGRGRIG